MKVLEQCRPALEGIAGQLHRAAGLYCGCDACCLTPLMGYKLSSLRDRIILQGKEVLVAHRSRLQLPRCQSPAAMCGRT